MTGRPWSADVARSVRSLRGADSGHAGDAGDTGRNICEHLLPLLLLLVRDYGLHLVERAEGYGSGLGFLFDGELPLEDLQLLEREPFVHVISSRRLVFCERCWQSLGEWKRHRNEWT